jgi:hypothetical protein
MLCHLIQVVNADVSTNRMAKGNVEKNHPKQHTVLMEKAAAA